MKSRTVGISDIAIYIPHLRMDMDRLVEYRLKTLPDMKRHYERATRTTGQRSIRFPHPWEDPATMGAQAALKLLNGRAAPDPASMRYLAVGTETPMDYSKPLSANIQGMLLKAGVPVPSTLASYQVQHACAGATLALMGAGGLLALGGAENEYAVVVATDIAHYEAKSTAEVTQGAGSVALLVDHDPALLELDFVNMGYCSQDVDDFFRPLGSTEAKAKGRYSMECYKDSLDGALNDYATRNQSTVEEVLSTTDYFVLHAPFRNMPGMAIEKMFERYLGLDPAAAQEHLASRGFYESLDVVADVGNTYTASSYLALAALLQNRYQAEGDSIIGKTILIASYGSGNTMIVMSAKIARRAPEIISSWPESLVNRGTTSSVRDYEIWMNLPYLGVDGPVADDQMEVPADAFYLSRIREDGYREYEFAHEQVSWNAVDTVPESVARANAVSFREYIANPA